MDADGVLIEERKRANQCRTRSLARNCFVLTLVVGLIAETRQDQPNVFPIVAVEGHGVPGTRMAFSSVSEVRGAVDWIIAASGLQKNFSIRETTEIDNAAAVILNQERVIVYNPDFFRRLRRETGEDWAAISILAHEVAHHLNGHTLTNDGSRPPTELQADYFSGFILRKMGAGREDAEIALKTFAPRQGSATHPPRSERLKAVREGWNAACRAQAGCVPDRQLGNPGLSTLPVPQNPLPLVPGSTRTLHVVTDVCNLHGRTVHVTALNQLIDPNRANRVVGARQTPLSSTCAFDLTHIDGSRFCVAIPSGTVLVPGQPAVGQCSPLR